MPNLELTIFNVQRPISLYQDGWKKIINNIFLFVEWNEVLHVSKYLFNQIKKYKFL